MNGMDCDKNDNLLQIIEWTSILRLNKKFSAIARGELYLYSFATESFSKLISVDNLIHRVFCMVSIFESMFYLLVCLFLNIKLLRVDETDYYVQRQSKVKDSHTEHN